jgi:hypothetical protein
MIIKRLNIFLTWKQSDQILTDKVKSEISQIPYKMPEEFDKFIDKENQILYNEVKRQMSKPEKALEFIESWLKFDIVGIEAKQNTLNLLKDFSTTRSGIVLKDNRVEYTNNDYDFEKHYPLGQEFSLICEVPKIKNWYGKILQKSTEIEIVIDTQKVTRLEGEFKFLFTIYFQHQKLVFGNGISVIPYDG